MALIGYANRLLTAALTAGSSAAGLGPTNLQSNQGDGASAWQTAAGALTPGTGAWLQADAGAAVAWRAVSIHRSNLTPDASLRVMLGTTAGAADVADATVTGLAPGYGQLVLALPAEVTARHLRLELTDAANPDGFISIALAYAGAVWEPAQAVAYGSAPGRAAEVDEVVTRGGQEFPELRFVRRSWDITWKSFAPAEVWDRIMELARVAEGGGNILFVPFPTSVDLQREVVFGRLAIPGGVTISSHRARDWRATITERL